MEIYEGQLFSQNLVCILDLVAQHFCVPVFAHVVVIADALQGKIHHNGVVESLALEVMAVAIVEW